MSIPYETFAEIHFYECPTCGTSFLTKAGLKGHKKSHDRKLTKKEWAVRRVARTLNPTDVKLHEFWCAYKVHKSHPCTCENPDYHADECSTYKGGACDCLPWHDKNLAPRI